MLPDNTFAAAVVDAYVRAHLMCGPDEAAQLYEVSIAAEPEPEEVVIPFGCVLYHPTNRTQRIVPQMYIAGRKTSLGHYPYTTDGATLAAKVRAAAVAVKQAGGDAQAIRAAARQAREEGV